MKIGYLIPDFPGQTHIFFWREIQALESMGIEVDIVSTKHPPSNIMSHTWTSEAQIRTTYLFPPTKKLLGIVQELLRCHLAGWLRCLQAIFKAKNLSFSEKLRLFALIFMGAEVSHLAKIRNWQHLHIHSCADSANIGMFAYLISKLPYSITLHGPLKDYGKNQEQKWNFARFAIVITQELSKQVQQNLAGYLPQKVAIAPMGVNTEVFKRKSLYTPWNGSEVCRIFSCGRLNYCKGHAHLIEAVYLLKEQGINVKLDIAGEDEQGGTGYHQELEKMIEKLGLNDHVNLLGAVSEARIRDSLEQAHIFVLASINEPLGVAIMEAMAMEVPVIVTVSEGVKELVQDGIDGLLVEPQNPPKLAAKIIYLLDNKDLSINLGKEARIKVIEHFNSQVSAKVLVKTIGSLE